MNLLNNAKITRVMAAVAAGQATNSGDILDMEGFESVMFIAKVSDVTSGSVVTLTAQQNTANQTSGMATLTSSCTFTDDDGTSYDDDLLILDLVKPQERYIRPQLVTATQNCAIAGIIAIQYGAKKVPITQGATVQDSDVVISPDEA